MPDYKLFNVMINSIEIMRQAQRETEGMFISADEPALKVLFPDKKNERSED